MDNNDVFRELNNGKTQQEAMFAAHMQAEARRVAADNSTVIPYKPMETPSASFRFSARSPNLTYPQTTSPRYERVYDPRTLTEKWGIYPGRIIAIAGAFLFWALLILATQPIANRLGFYYIHFYGAARWISSAVICVAALLLCWAIPSKRARWAVGVASLFFLF